MIKKKKKIKNTIKESFSHGTQDVRLKKWKKENKKRLYWSQQGEVSTDR